MLQSIKKILQPAKFRLINNKELLCKSWEILSINGVQIYDTDISGDWKKFALSFNEDNTFESFPLAEYQAEIFPCRGKYMMPQHDTLMLSNGLVLKLSCITEVLLSLDAHISFCGNQPNLNAYPARFNFLSNDA